MGTTALIIFLGSLGIGMLCLATLAYSGLRIYRTARYAYKDSQPWMESFQEYYETMMGTVGIMEERVQAITETGREMREAVDDIHDAVEEMRSNPLLRAVRIAGRLRR